MRRLKVIFNPLKPLVALFFSLFLITGCTSEQQNEQAEATKNHQEARNAAWSYAQQKEWTEKLEEDTWESAKVETIIAPDHYEYTEPEFKGKEVLLVTFTEEGKPVASVTNFLVDHEANKVIGYLPGE